MNKKFNKAVASVLAGLFFTLFGTKAVKAQEAEYTQVTSPQPGFEVIQPAVNGDNTGIFKDTSGIADYSFSYIQSKVENGEYFLNYQFQSPSTFTLPEDEYLFVAILNKPQNEVVGFSKLEKDAQDVKYSGKLTIPYYSDKFEVHVYKQKKDEPDFTLKSENFICKSKFCSSTINCFYTYGTEDTNHIPLLNKDGNVIADLSNKSNSLVRYTPNFYSVLATDGEVFNHSEGDLAVIKLPEDKKDLIAEDDKIVPTQIFSPSYTTDSDYGVLGDGAVTADFYMPDGIDEFEVWCYRGQITDDAFRWKCKIKLNRVY